MIQIARSSRVGEMVKWICLKPNWEVLPFDDASFDGIIASSVFEYLVDVPRVTAELARVLSPEGIMLLTVPNPYNAVRDFEAWLRSILLSPRLSFLHRIRRIGSFAAYLRLSQNRFKGDGWYSVLRAARFVALDECAFKERVWRAQAARPLVLLVVKKLGENETPEFLVPDYR